MVGKELVGLGVMTRRWRHNFRKHPFRTILKWAFLLYLIYFLAGVLVVPLFHREIVQEETVYTDSFAKERVLCIDDNEDALLWRLRMIDSAQDELILTTFDWRDDNSGQDIMAALQQAAARGVRVRILIDGLSEFLHLRDNSHFRSLALSENIEIRIYNPVSLLRPWRTNYRMHDKYLIVDEQVYLLGGRNTYDLFLGTYVDKYNIDRDVLVYEETPQEASSLTQLLAYFEEIWTGTEVQTLKVSESKKLKDAQEELRIRQETLQTQYPQIGQEVDWEAETIEAEHISLLTNGAEPANKQPKLLGQLTDLMREGSDILIQTPYIICNRAMYEELEAVCENTETVRIMTNAVENGANPFGCSDYLNQKERILDTGAAVDEWMGGKSLHTKTVLIDDSISVIGSFNLDMRSTYLDTELMLVIDCPELNQQLRAQYDTMALKCRQVSADGTEAYGAMCEPMELSSGQNIMYHMLRIFLRPFRYLL
jgi:phosphatidylserine/phosphatidylglycerophosphate/cardiolipin synthase-like enzyme